MPSDLHERLVDDVADAIVWGSVEEPILRDVSLVREPSYAAPLTGLPATGRRADLYILPNDELGPILLEVYPNASKEVVVRGPADYGVARIGHEGAFRRGMEGLWDEMFDWLTAGDAG